MRDFHLIIGLSRSFEIYTKPDIEHDANEARNDGDSPSGAPSVHLKTTASIPVSYVYNPRNSAAQSAYTYC